MTSPRGPDSAMISRTHSTTAVLLMMMLVTAVGCREVKTSARLQSGPTFLLAGSGKLASFRIYGPQTGRKIATPFDAKSLTWYVQPSDGYFKGIAVLAHAHFLSTAKPIASRWAKRLNSHSR